MSPPQLVVLRQTGLGDLLTALPALRAVRRHFPTHWIRTTCPSWLLPLATRLNVADDFIVEDRASADPTDHERADGSMLRKALCRSETPDVVVALRVPEPGLLQELLRQRPRILVAYGHPEVDATADFPEFSFSDHILVRWERLLDWHCIPTRRTDLHVALWPDGAQTDGAHTVVHVGAGSPARCWPALRWGEVARSLTSYGHRVVLTGSAGEAAVVARVCRDAGLSTERNVFARTDAVALAELVAGARLVLSCDTGIAHLAVALRRRSVTLFGGVPPAWWGPPPGCALHRTLWKGRFGEPYGAEPALGLLEISAGEVLDAALNPEWPDATNRAYCCPYLAGDDVSSETDW